jgi:phosphatidylglycerol---prolipoprotein diacylglyceryl transferase
MAPAGSNVRTARSRDSHHYLVDTDDPPAPRAVAANRNAAPPQPNGSIPARDSAPPRMAWLRRRAMVSGCTKEFDEVCANLPQAVAITYWGEGTGRVIPITVTGRLHNATPGSRDRIETSASVPALEAEYGRFAFTTKVFGVAAGSWNVNAARADGTFSQRRAQDAVVASRPIQISFGPAVRVWTWPVLVGAGTVLAIVIQAMLLSGRGADALLAVGVSFIACLLGYVGAKAWYLASARQHPRQFMTTGACIQGFLLVAFTVLALGGAVTGIGAGTLLDATTPGLFLGMAVGRPGCFLTGCCAGRPTASRWGLWSSDRTLAIRRVPVQLWEAGLALVIGVSTLAMVLGAVVPVPGGTFVAAMATYTGVRQFLFPFRADPHTRRGRYGAVAACAAVLAADVAVIVMHNA